MCAHVCSGVCMCSCTRVHVWCSVSCVVSMCGVCARVLWCVHCAAARVCAHVVSRCVCTRVLWCVHVRLHVCAHVVQCELCGEYVWCTCTCIHTVCSRKPAGVLCDGCAHVCVHACALNREPGSRAITCGSQLPHSWLCGSHSVGLGTALSRSTQPSFVSFTNPFHTP